MLGGQEDLQQFAVVRPSPALLNDVQLVPDEAIFTVIAHGWQLPSFILEVDRLDAIHKRLSQS